MTDSRGSWRVLRLAADSPAGLDHLRQRAARLLADSPRTPVESVADRIHAGHDAGRYRSTLIARDGPHAAALLAEPDPGLVVDGQTLAADRTTVFVFPGVGDHHAGMARDAYENLKAFREALDETAELLRPALGRDLRSMLYPPDVTAEPEQNVGAFATLQARGESSSPLHQTRFSQPIVFAVEYCLAKLLMSWGVMPGGTVGYSVGEYIAACLAGVFPLTDGLRLVAARAALMEQAPPGAMLVVSVGGTEVSERLRGYQGRLSLAAVNGVAQCVVSGAPDAIASLAKGLGAQGVATLPVPTRHAFHSSLMASVEEPMRGLVSKVRLRPPAVPVLSNVSGTWLRSSEAQDRDYWTQHMRRTIRFADNLAELWRLPNVLAVELGAGQMLRSLANQHPDRAAAQNAVVLSAVRTRSGRHGSVPALLAVAAHAWVRGENVDWAAINRSGLSTTTTSR